MINPFLRAGSTGYHGLGGLFSVPGLSLNLGDRGDLIAWFYMCPVRTGHSFLCHLYTSVCELRGEMGHFVCLAVCA